MEDIVKKAKERFLKSIREYGKDPYTLESHLSELEKWSEIIFKEYPKIDKEVILISIWLHDIGHYPITEEDHAIKSERIAREFLKKENYPDEKTNKILHCIRAHRCKDIQPETIEAKLIAFMDSASHLTDKIYLDMAQKGKVKEAQEKLKRDYRDLKNFPEFKEKLTPLYDAWEILLKEYSNLRF